MTFGPLSQRLTARCFRTPSPLVLTLAGGTLLLAGGALAQSASDPFSSVSTTVTTVVTSATKILYIVAALEILGLGTLAMFGRFKWSWAFGVGGGVALIALATSIITYITPH